MPYFAKDQKIYLVSGRTELPDGKEYLLNQNDIFEKAVFKNKGTKIKQIAFSLPGITCIWQVSGRNKIGFEEWMRMDLEYIDHWSLALDLKLMFRTFWVVITGYGAQ